MNRLSLALRKRILTFALTVAFASPGMAQIITESTPGIPPAPPRPKPIHHRPRRKPPAAVAATPKFLWRTRLRDSDGTPAVTGDGEFIAAGSDLVQLDSAGRNVFLCETGPTSATPTADENRAYVGTDRGTFYAFDRHSGAQLWKTTLAGDTILTAPALGAGRVYIESSDNYVYGIAALTGGEIWKFFRPDGSLGYSSPVFRNGALYVCGDSTIYSLDPAAGKQIWHTPIDGKSLSTPFVDDKRIYVGGDQTGLTALAPTDGHQLWSFSGKGPGEWFGAPLVADGIAYVGTDSGNIYAVDAATGKLKWSAHIVTSTISQPAIDPVGHVVYVTSTTTADSPTVTAFDMRTGAKVWDYKVGSVEGSPVVEGNFLYVASSTGYFYCFGLR